MSNKNEYKVPYPKRDDKVGFILGVADNSLILAQRLSELTGHAPTLEIDMALSNIALDLFGEVRNFFQYAAKLMGDGMDEDKIAFLREERDYRNVLLTEQPNEDFAYVIVRQFLYDQFHYLALEKLQSSEDGQLAAVARKSIKEVAYHRDFSTGWIKRLGDGTEESKRRTQNALNDLWEFTGELFHKTAADEKMIEAHVGIDYDEIKDEYHTNVKEVLDVAALEIPETVHFQSGGKEGKHTEYMGHLLTEMQYMQRTYPGLEW